MLREPLLVTIGDSIAESSYAGLVGPGLYQFNIKIPILPPGEYPVVVVYGGVSTRQEVVLAVAGQ